MFSPVGAPLASRSGSVVSLGLVILLGVTCGFPCDDILGLACLFTSLALLLVSEFSRQLAAAIAVIVDAAWAFSATASAISPVAATVIAAVLASAWQGGDASPVTPLRRGPHRSGLTFMDIGS